MFMSGEHNCTYKNYNENYLEFTSHIISETPEVHFVFFMALLFFHFVVVVEQ